MLFAWLSALGFFLQIYYDFSGYSDMAIGLGRILGFHFPENFRYPLLLPVRYGVLAAVAHDLGRFVSGLCLHSLRRKPDREAAAGWGTSCWSGASPVCGTGPGGTFSYGDCSTPYCCWEKSCGMGLSWPKGPWFSHIYLLLSVLLGFVLFQGGSLEQSWGDFRAMLGAGSIPTVSRESLYALRNHGVLLILGALGATPLPGRLYQRWSKGLQWIEPLLLALLLLLCTAYLVDGSFNPFLYFRF